MRVDNPPDQTITDVAWSFIRWAAAAFVGGVTAAMGFFLKQMWNNAQILAEIRHDTANLRQMMAAQHADNSRRLDEMSRRIEWMERHVSPRRIEHD